MEDIKFMAKKRNPKIPKNDFEYDEGEICGFTADAPIIGECVSSFSFDDNSITESLAPNTKSKSNDDTFIQSANKNISLDKDNLNNNIPIETKAKNLIKTDIISNSTKDIFDNRRTPLPNGAAPSIDGETPSIKRSYTLRSSTIRKINELKSIHPDINVCVSTIVDIAIDHYYNHIVNEGGTQ